MMFKPILNETDKENYCLVKSFKIYLHKPNEIPTPYHESIYLNYEESMEVTITLSSHRTDEALRDFHPDVRKCFFNDEGNLKFFKTYSRTLCEWECKANLTLEICGCVKFSMPRDKETKICSLKELVCVEKIDDMKHQCACYSSSNDVKYAYKLNRASYEKKLWGDHVSKT